MQYNELHAVFEHDVKYKEKYYSALSSIKTSKHLGMTSLGLLGGGLILVSIDLLKSNNIFEDSFTTFKIGILAFLAASITGSIAIIKNQSGRKRVKKIIDEYNNSIDGLGDLTKKPKLNFIEAHSGYGFGIAIQF